MCGFFPLKNRAKGKTAPTISWLSGSFYKQQCDEKHMLTSVCGTETGVLLPPREPEGQAALLLGPLDMGHLTDLPARVGGKPAEVGGFAVGRTAGLPLQG